MKKGLRLFSAFAAVFLCLSCLMPIKSAFSYNETDTDTTANTSSSTVDYSGLDYYFKKIDVKIDIGKDNVYSITENIDAFFMTSKHGIYRTLPMYNDVKRNDGSQATNNVQITDVSCHGENYTTSYEDGCMKLKLGDANRTLVGAKSYTISYKYNLGKDTLKDADEFYYNVIGTKWEAPIQNVSFTLNFPEDFDDSKLGFSTGKTGTIGSDIVKWSRSGNSITGQLTQALNPYEALTARVELKDNYFSEAKAIFDKSSIVSLVGTTLCAAICIYIYFRQKSKNFHISPIEFYPPDNIISTDCALIKEGEITRQDTVSLLLILANKGYIRIDESESTGLFSSKKHYTFTKLRIYDGNDEVEREFMNGLFSHSGLLSFGKSTIATTLFGALNNATADSAIDQTTDSELSNSFYKTADEIKKISKLNRKPLYFKSGFFTAKKCYVLILILQILVGIVFPILAHGGVIDISAIATQFVTFIPIFAFVFVFCFAFISTANTVVSRVIVGIVATIAMIICMEFSSSILYTQRIAAICSTCVFAITYVLQLFVDNTRTERGKEMLGRVEGFEEFIKTAEKDRLEMLAEQNPQYYYNILPYAYVLGISDVWTKNFENLVIENPNWYGGHDMFTYAAMDSMMRSCGRTMTSTPSSSGSGGGGSGGGSSGGGSGGGGGGAW